MADGSVTVELKTDPHMRTAGMTNVRRAVSVTFERDTI
jgi:hypothetical protein